MAEANLSGINRTLQILQLVATSESPLNARDISGALAIPLSSVYRHLVSLQRWGLLSEASGDGSLIAGPLSLQLALRYQNDTVLSTLARPLLMRLAKQSQETVALMVATHFQAICIDLIESQQALRCAFAPGKGQPLVRGASAKALLAFMQPSHRQEALERNLSTPAERTRLEDELNAIRTAGFAESDSEIDAGVWGLSAPLFGRPGQLQGVVTVMAPSERGRARRDELLAMTIETARRISLYLEDEAAN